MKIKLNVKLCWLTYNFTLVVEEVMRVADSIFILDLKDDLKCSRGTRVEKIRKIRSYDFNITKVGNKFYGVDHITANEKNI